MKKADATQLKDLLMKIPIRNLILILVSLMILSCKTNRDKLTFTDEKSEIKQTDSIKVEPTLISDEYEPYKLDYIKVDTSIKKYLIDNNFAREISTYLINWVDYYKRLTPNFKIQDFKNYKTTVIQPYQESLGDKESQKRFFNLYNPYLIWSPDSSKAIDLYSYSIVLDYDSNGNVIGMRDVDCKLALIDVKKQKKINLMTYGPAGEFQDAFWINNDSFIVAIIGFDLNETYEPYYSMIELKTYLKRDYKIDYNLQLKENEYVENRFKEVKFK